MKRITHTDDSLNVVYFAERYPGWHGYAKDKRTEKAVERARVLDGVEVNEFRQFKAKDRQSANP